MALKTFLLTGFGPFGKHESNPSSELLQLRPWEATEGWNIETVTLPVSWKGSVPVLSEALQRKPSAILSIGLAEGATQLRLETLAINIAHPESLDVEGALPDRETLIPGAPHAYRATWPRDRLLGALEKGGFKATYSFDAGTYLCNATLFRVLHHLDESNEEGIPAGFLHIPPVSEAWPLSRLREAVERIVQLMAGGETLG